MTKPVLMIDTIGAKAFGVPDATPIVGAYVSGTGDVPWDPIELSRFPESRKILIYQGAGTYPGVGGYDMLDCEEGALTVAQVGTELVKRVAAGYEWTIVYGDAATLGGIEDYIVRNAPLIWAGHLYSFLANWNLDQEEATLLLGTQIHGMTCIGVQWASPSSNPDTICPGTESMLKHLGYDLSIVDGSKLPLPVPPPPPITVPAPTIAGVVVHTTPSGTFVAQNVTSTNGGESWS